MPPRKLIDRMTTPILENTVLRESVTELLATSASFSEGGHRSGPGMHTHARILLMEAGTVSFQHKVHPVNLAAGDMAILPIGWTYDALVHPTGRAERCLRFTGSWAASLSDTPRPYVFRNTEHALRQEISLAIDAIFEKRPEWDWAFMHAVASIGKTLQRNRQATLCQQVEQIIMDE